MARPTRWTTPPSGSKASNLGCRRFHRLRVCFDLKPSIKGIRAAISRRKEVKQRGCYPSPEEDWRGNHCQNHLRPSLLLHQRLLFTLHHDRGVVHPMDWEGSSSPPGLWVFGGNLIQSLYVWSLLKSIWCPLNDYRIIYVIPMVDIMVWDDICYASIIVLILYGFSHIGNKTTIHDEFIYALCLVYHVMRCLTPPSVDRWERCEITYIYKSLQ
jgi:hypothetical protein